MLAFTIKDDTRVWQALFNAVICLFMWMQAKPDMALNVIFYAASASFSAYFIYSFWTNWRSGNAILYCQLDHQNNHLVFIESHNQRIFSLENGSKANAFGLWLRLKSSELEQGEVVKLQYFFARWQMTPRAFRALHRHLIWYLD
jgi:hypothetical protein